MRTTWGSSHPFPQYLSNPIQVLWFESDELAVIVFCFTLAMLYGGLLWLFLFVGPYTYSRTKKAKPRGHLFHLLYMIGLIKMRGYPDYFEQSFYE